MKATAISFSGISTISLFHTRSTEGRHANPVGGTFAYASVVSPPPAVRPPLARQEDRPAQILHLGWPISPFAKLLRERHSVRDFDDEHPVTLAELARFLDTTARVLSEWKSDANFDGGPEIDLQHETLSVGRQRVRTGTVSDGLELRGLARGLYHYDAGRPRAGGDRASRTADSRRFRRQPSLPWTRLVRRRS